MPDRTPSDLASFRLQQARDDLQGAEVALSANLLKASANRSYYCIFHAMRAVLALERFDSKTHSGVISAFNRKYIKTGIFSVKLSEIIKKAFRVRNNSDYQDFYVISKGDVETQIANAKEFLAVVEAYVNAKITPNSL